jgi:hypothetical protein
MIEEDLLKSFGVDFSEQLKWILECKYSKWTELDNNKSRWRFSVNKIMRFRDPEMRGRIFRNQTRDCYLSRKAVLFCVNLCVCIELSQTFRLGSVFQDLRDCVKFSSFYS